MNEERMTKDVLQVVFSDHGRRIDFAVLLYKYMAIVKDHQGVNLVQYNHPLPLDEDESAILELIDRQIHAWI